MGAWRTTALAVVFLVGGAACSHFPSGVSALPGSACAASGAPVAVLAGGNGSRSDVFTVDARMVSRRVTSDGRSYDPAISGDGSRLVFTRNDGSTQADAPAPAGTLWTAGSSRTGTPTLLAKGVDLHSPALSPDGAEVLVVSGGPVGFPRLGAGTARGGLRDAQPALTRDPQRPSCLPPIGLSAGGRRT